MSLLSQPLISYAEVAVDLPCSNDLWLASSAIEWKAIYLAQAGPTYEQRQLPSLRSCMDDCSPIFDFQASIAVEASLVLVIAAVWPLIWQYDELKTVATSSGPHAFRSRNSTLNSRLQEITDLLQHIRINIEEHRGSMNASTTLLLEQCLMHLRVSPRDVQVLAGKNGEDAAKAVLAGFVIWVQSSDARRALFHAGQIIRAARDCPSVMLQQASAVAVYHASLTFWAYAVSSRRCDVSRAPSPHLDRTQRSLDMVRLDIGETPEVKRYLVLGKGAPCIMDHTEAGHLLELSRSSLVMNSIIALLRSKYQDGQGLHSPLLENLCILMQSLGKAAPSRK